MAAKASAASPAATEHIDVTPLSELLNQERKTEPSHQRHATPNHISLLDRRETQVRPAICSCPAGCTYECEYGLSTCWLCDPRNYRPDNGQCCCPCEGCYPDTEPDEDTAATEHSDVTLASAASPAATEHSDVTATEHSHRRMYSHDEWRNMRLKCKWCSIEGQCLSFTDVDPYGPLCDRCYDAARPPRFSYVDMVLRPFLGTLPEVCNLVAEYAYRSCADFLDWQKHMCNNRYVPEIHD